MKAIQNWISSSSKDKVLLATAEDNVLQGQVTIQNCAIAETNSAVVDLAAFNAKARISAALQHVKNAELAVYALEYPTQGLARSLRRGRQ